MRYGHIGGKTRAIHDKDSFSASQNLPSDARQLPKIPTLAKSFLTVCIQAVFGLPCGHFTFLRCSLRASSLAFLDGSA